MIKTGQALYLSVEVWRALLLIAKKESTDIDAQRARVADEVADKLLREAIAQKYPDLFKIAKMGAELIKTNAPMT